MPLYYQDDLVTLYHGDSLEVLPTLDIRADVLLTDPPYFKVKQDEWDNQWDKASEFLDWMGDFLDHAKPLLTPQASVWVFASPAMTSSVERLIGERFRVLNSIRWAKSGGDNLRRVSMPAMRSFVSIWEGILFAEQKDDPYEVASRDLYLEALKPMGRYFSEARKAAGVDRLSVAAMFPSESGNLTGCVANWERGTHTPTQDQYKRIVELIGPEHLPLNYQELTALRTKLGQEFEKSRDAISHTRRPFNMTDRRLTEDIWSFPSVSAYPGKHPCEKPEAILRHMIQVSSRPGDTVLDAFAGSGATLITAMQTGRKAVGIEKDEQWCEHAANRLSQGTLELEWTA